MQFQGFQAMKTGMKVRAEREREKVRIYSGSDQPRERKERR